MKLPLFPSSQEKNSNSRPPFLLDNSQFSPTQNMAENLTKNSNSEVSPADSPANQNDDLEANTDSSFSFQTKKKPFPTNFSSQPANSFFGLNLDILWAGVAIGCVLGVLMFWFQGVQPTLLRGYTATAIETLDTLGQKNTAQVNAVIQSYNTMSERVLYNSLDVCNVNQLYTNQAEDVVFLDSQQVALLPAANIQTIKPYNGFYVQSFKDIYQPLFETYSQKNQEYSQYVTNAKAIPFYLQYRNTWIQSCVDIRNGQSNVEVVQNVCLKLKTATDEYTQNTLITKPDLWKPALPIAQEGIAKCQQYSNGQNFGRWQLEWLASYDRLMSIQPDFTKDAQKVVADGELFSTDINKARLTVEQQFTEKKSGLQLYFMNVSF